MKAPEELRRDIEEAIYATGDLDGIRPTSAADATLSTISDRYPDCWSILEGIKAGRLRAGTNPDYRDYSQCEPCRKCHRKVPSPCHDSDGYHTSGPWDFACRGQFYPEENTLAAAPKPGDAP